MLDLHAQMILDEYTENLETFEIISNVVKQQLNQYVKDHKHTQKSGTANAAVPLIEALVLPLHLNKQHRAHAIYAYMYAQGVRRYTT